MLKTQISLLGVIFLAVFVEAVVMPGLWSPLRVDLLLGMVIGVIVHLGFSQGLFFVLASSLLLQAFSGARPGLIPLFYVFTFIVIDVIKDFIYLENAMTQVLLATAFFVLASGALVVFLDIHLMPLEIVPMVLGSVLTGIFSPVMVSIVGRVKRAYEA